MADKPIIFSGSMVRALLKGRKTQTRRVLRWQFGELDKPQVWEDGSWHVTASDGTNLSPLDVRFRIGDQLWVREACRAEELSRPPRERPATRRERETLKRTTVVGLSELDGADGVRYLADDAWLKINNTREAGDAWCEMFHYGQGRGTGPRTGRQVPSIHMPRWASRLTLTVTDVRVQRLQEISEGDAVAEGIRPFLSTGSYVSPKHSDGKWRAGDNAYEMFRELWDDLYGADAWAANPWVLALTFDVEQGNIDHLPSTARSSVFIHQEVRS